MSSLKNRLKTIESKLTHSEESKRFLIVLCNKSDEEITAIKVDDVVLKLEAGETVEQLKQRAESFSDKGILIMIALYKEDDLNNE